MIAAAGHVRDLNRTMTPGSTEASCQNRTLRAESMRRSVEVGA